MAHQFTQAQHDAWHNNLPGKATGVMTILRDPSGRILIVKTNYKVGWSFVGGIVEPGESPLQAALREIQEEVDLALASDQINLLGVQYNHPKGERKDFLRIFFISDLDESQASAVHLQKSELDEYKFIPTNELMKYAGRSMLKVVNDIFEHGYSAGYVEGEDLILGAKA